LTLLAGRKGYDGETDRDEAFVKTLGYLHLNLIRKGLVDSAVDSRWRTARIYQTRKADPIEVDLLEWWESHILVSLC
jgi:hypothetical protein